jgi:Ser/Thr protein kinase RdoA (MazF antagonist)
MKHVTEVKKIIKSKWPKVKIKSIKEFPEGYNNIAFDVKLSNGDYVIKLIKLKGYETYSLKQKHLRTLVRRKFKDFPIPKIIKSDFSKRLIDKPYIIAEKMDGKSLQSTHKKIPNKKELYSEIGELYGKLHSFKLKNYGELDSSLKIIKKYSSWYLENCKNVEKLFEKIEANKLLSNKAIEEYKKFFEKNKYLLKKEIGPRLCHGDAAQTNILIRKSGNGYVVSGIIDFEFARSSGVTKELFHGLRTFEKKWEYKESLVEGYSKWGKLPKEWEKLVLLYYWMGNLGQLTRIKKMKWRNLNEEDTKKRKKELRSKALLTLRKTAKEIGVMK